MPLLVVRTFAVYGATAALLLLLAHRFVQPIRRRTAVLLACAPLLFTGGAMSTGAVYAPIDIVYQAQPFASLPERRDVGPPRTPLLSDVVSSMIPWQKAVRVSIKQGRLPLWNPFVLAGEPLAAMQSPAVLHPGTWIGFLLPLPQAWTFQMALRFLFALLAAYLFCSDLGCSEIAALVGAVAWGFSDFLAFWVGYTVGATVAPFPLLLLGLSRLIRDADRRAVGLTVAALFLIVTAGHPETLLFAVVGAGLYFLFLLARAGGGRRLRPVLLSCLAGAIALGLSAVLLAPMAEILPRTHEHNFRSVVYAHLERSAPVAESLGRLVLNFVPHARGVSGKSAVAPGFGTPAAYGGSLLFPLAVAGLFSRHRARWGLLLLGVFGVAVSVRLRGLTDALAALPLLDISVLDYFVFLGAFAVAALAALGAERLRDGEGCPAFLFGSFGAAGLLLWLSVRERPAMERLGLSPADWRGYLLHQLVPLLLAMALVCGLSRRRRATVGVPLLLVLLVAQRELEVGRLYPTAPASAFYPHLGVLDRIPRGSPYRMAALWYAFVPNVATLYELEDVRGYEAMTLRSQVLTYPLWCQPVGAWFNRIDDPTRPFLSFLNVRWVIAPAELPAPAGWSVLAEGEGVRVLENPRVLPRAFVPKFFRGEPEPDRTIELLKSIDDFADRGVVASKERAETWIRNGEARVAITAYEPQAMEFEIDAREEALVATSITGWPGWKAEIGGRALSPIPYNLGFLSFRVPAGRHRLRLRYMPDGFRYGLAITVVTLAISAAWLAASLRAS